MMLFHISAVIVVASSCLSLSLSFLVSIVLHVCHPLKQSSKAVLEPTSYATAWDYRTACIPLVLFDMVPFARNACEFPYPGSGGF
ncbi:hypothetical protein F5Y18DRAFT_411086 [Xylariaceae sp. FL1019]|nr:hypothetical protein F5Y18DRAFT_411086 [Xylariaceae sp. FL1019]